jgi:hypothetical protein
MHYRAMDELLNEEIFDTLDDARRKLALWRYDYNNPSRDIAAQCPAGQGSDRTHLWATKHPLKRPLMVCVANHCRQWSSA